MPAHHYDRDKQGHLLRKNGPRALFDANEVKADHDLFTRLHGGTRLRIDDIRRHDGTRSLREVIERMVDLYDFMMGKRKGEPTWLASVQQEYRRREEAAKAEQTTPTGGQSHVQPDRTR
jgi:hypothetical protein